MDAEGLNYIIENKETRLVSAMKKMDKAGKGVLFIVNTNNILEGTLTDGDIRRWIIQSGKIDVAVDSVMRRNPRFLKKDYARMSIDPYVFMSKEKIDAVPIVDDNNRLLDVIFRFYKNCPDELSNTDSLKNINVIIMAGGKGTRLYPYTKILPKPLIPIGDVPILERIMNRFHQYGVQNFYLIVNYKREMIKSYFSDAKPAYQIHYVDEQKSLGTAGGISLLDKKFTKPVVVTNCDTLIEQDYDKIVEYHVSNKNDITVVSSLKTISIPYGVIHLKGNGRIESMEEKPQISTFINTGMYVINPEFLNWIPGDRVFHMTDLLEEMIKKGKNVGMYPISEDSFLDMGEIEELRKMEKRLVSG